MQRTKLSQGNCSPLTLHNMINIALFTKHICTPCWPGGRFFLSRYDGGNRVLQIVSQIVFFLRLFPVDHCISTAEAFLYRVPFPLLHMPVCAAEAFAFSGPLSERFPWLTYRYRDRGNFETPNTLFEVPRFQALQILQLSK